MKNVVLGALLLALMLSAQLGCADTPFVLFMYDSACETTLGAFPPDRQVWARAIAMLAGLKAKAVVLKLFFDQPRIAAGDAALAASLSKIPTILQASIDNSERNPNALDARFTVRLPNVPRKLMKGTSGWLPIPSLSEAAYDVGFVNIRQARLVPMLYSYKGATCKSLWLAILHVALPGLSIDGTSLSYKSRKLALNANGGVEVSYPAKDELSSVRLTDLLDGKVGQSTIEGRIAILAYDGDKQDLIDTPSGKIKAHRAFFYSLEDVYRRLRE